MMDFARAQLQKYGWKNGEGLGKNKNGISSALKPKLKNNKGGLGHDPGEEFTYNWWEHAFNAAASNVVVKNKKNGVKVTSKISTTSKLSTKRPDFLLSNYEDCELTYGRFKKTTLLVGSGEERFEPEVQQLEVKNETVSLSDEQLLLACGGLTAHKAARHGLGLNGKLKRLKEQDKIGISYVSSDRKKRSNK